MNHNEVFDYLRNTYWLQIKQLDRKKNDNQSYNFHIELAYQNNVVCTTEISSFDELKEYIDTLSKTDDYQETIDKIKEKKIQEKNNEREKIMNIKNDIINQLPENYDKLLKNTYTQVDKNYRWKLREAFHDLIMTKIEIEDGKIASEIFNSELITLFKKYYLMFKNNLFVVRDYNDRIFTLNKASDYFHCLSMFFTFYMEIKTIINSGTHAFSEKDVEFMNNVCFSLKDIKMMYLLWFHENIMTTNSSSNDLSKMYAKYMNHYEQLEKSHINYMNRFGKNVFDEKWFEE